ncbi:hypothetical protein AMTRI_Chr11g157270 [Amborella trichopoda]
MAPSKIAKALGAVKDRTTIGLVKMSGGNIPDIEVAVVKSTRHDDHPANERHIHELLSLTAYSRAHVSACVATLARRLNRTRNWAVALKVLMLVHRLMSEGEPAYEQELFYATRRGTRLLNMSDFRDASSRSTDSWDFSALVRTVAMYLDERLEFSRHGTKHQRRRRTSSGDSPYAATPVRELRPDRLFARMQHLHQILDRFLACKPTGAAKQNHLVVVALHPIVKESFQMYSEMAEAMGAMIDRFTDMEVPECVKVLEAFGRAGKQIDELEQFYNWFKTVAMLPIAEYPDLNKITQKKLDLMEDFIRDKCVSQSKRLQDPETEGEDAMTGIKALPAPPVNEEEATGEDIRREAAEVAKKKEPETEPAQEGSRDLISLDTDGAFANAHPGDQLALTLLGGEAAVGQSGTDKWEAFTDEGDKADWELALVQSTTGGLQSHKPALGGGFDVLLLDGLYDQAAKTSSIAYTGSASSMAGAGATGGQLLALPAPPGAAYSTNDPFSASTSVAPPAYVQMWDMGKRQALLVQEQQLWQHYAMDGMQGQLGMAQLQQQTGVGGYAMAQPLPGSSYVPHGPRPPHGMGGYTQTY